MVSGQSQNEERPGRLLKNMWRMTWNGTVKYQIVLDKKLLQDTDQAARRTKRNRSALVRDALREHLRD